MHKDFIVALKENLSSGLKIALLGPRFKMVSKGQVSLTMLVQCELIISASQQRKEFYYKYS